MVIKVKVSTSEKGKFYFYSTRNIEITLASLTGLSIVQIWRMKEEEPRGQSGFHARAECWEKSEILGTGNEIASERKREKERKSIL